MKPQEQINKEWEDLCKGTPSPEPDEETFYQQADKELEQDFKRNNPKPYAYSQR